jgi:probable F420-dependent oxidoreductase
LGFHHIIVHDHVVGADPESRPPGWRTNFNYRNFIHEPLVTMGYLAGVTTRLEFCSEIIILPQRQPVLFAKQAAAADFLSGGRVRLGLGIGWNTVEFESLNEEFHNRGRRIEEQIDVLRMLWTQEIVDFEGRWHKIDRAGINPRPVHRQIPLWLGGSDDRVLRRTAVKADGWIAPAPRFQPGDESSKEMFARLRRYLREVGRDDSVFGTEGFMTLSAGTPDDWALTLQDWKALNVSHMAVSTGISPKRDEHFDRLEGFLSLV